MPLAYK